MRSLFFIALVLPSAITNDDKAVSVLKGHSNAVQWVVFSPDGKVLASGSADKTAKLWSVATGKEIRTLKGDDCAAQFVAFSPDGKLLAACGGPETNAITIWDVTSGKRVRTLKGHTYPPTWLAWGSDGKSLASCGGFDAIRIWDAANGKQVNHLLKDEEFHSIAFALDGKILIAPSGDGKLYLWDASSWKQSGLLRGHDANVTSVALAGNRLEVGSSTRALALSPDGKRLASGTPEGLVKVWDVDSGKCLRELVGHAQFIPAVAFSPDGRFLASASQDGTVRLWDLKVLLGPENGKEK